MFFVRFDSYALNSPEYIGPFDNEDDAYDYINARNGSLALSGVPTDVASYTVTNSWTKMTNQTHTLASRFTTFKEAVSAVQEHFGISNREATHWVWDHETTIGTDRAIWLVLK